MLGVLKAMVPVAEDAKAIRRHSNAEASLAFMLWCTP
jgi:hypothetical protein